MNPGQVVGFLWTIAAWFLILSVFAVPLWLNIERRRDQRDKAYTEEKLKATKPSTVAHWEQS